MKLPEPRPMAAMDAVWLHMDDPTNLMMVTAILWIDGSLGAEELRELVLDRIVGPYPHFRQRVVEPAFLPSSPMWIEEPDLDLDRHLCFEALPQPADQTILEDRVSVLMSTPLDRGHPLWQLHVIRGAPLPEEPGRTGARGTAIVCRLHHCMADGMALAQVLLGLTDELPGARGWATAPHRPEEPHPFARVLDLVWRTTGRVAHAGERVLQAGQDLVEHPGKLRQALHLAADSTFELGHLVALPPDHRTSLKSALGVHKRATWTRPVALSRVKELARAYGGTVNDLLIAAMAGALRRYLAERGEEVPEVRAFIPVNMRDTRRTVPRELGNRFSLVFLSLPVGEADRRRRVDRVKAHMDQLKASTEPAVAYGILQAMGRSPEAIEHVAVEIFGTKATAVMTNVPGPPRPIHLAGHRVAGIQFWVPQAGRVGLGVSIFSYAGQVSVGIASDVQCLPEPRELAQAFDTELLALGTDVGLPRA